MMDDEDEQMGLLPDIKEYLMNKMIKKFRIIRMITKFQNDKK